MSLQHPEVPIDYLYFLNFNELYRLKQVNRYFYYHHINDETIISLVRHRNINLVIQANTALSAILRHFYGMFYKFFSLHYPYDTIPKWVKYEPFKNAMINKAMDSFISDLGTLVLRDNSFKHVGHFIVIVSNDICLPLKTTISEKRAEIIISTYLLAYIKQPILEVLQLNNIDKLSSIRKIMRNLLLV